MKPVYFASWWSQLDDLLYPELRVRKRISARARAFAEAGIEVAVQFGFHYRFDFIPVFSTLHAYLRAVAEELHRHGIRFIDHYSFEIMARPPSVEEVEAYAKWQRHCVTLRLDPDYVRDLSFAGIRLNDLREVDAWSGKPTYSWAYQGELLCHENPQTRALNGEYLKRLLADVPVDGVHLDDMCKFAGLNSCVCSHCQERFKALTGESIPPISDTSFWGEAHAGRVPGNPHNPLFRQWLQMRYDSVSDFARSARAVVGDRILMTCCSGTGANAACLTATRFEDISRTLDFVMLENNGLSLRCADWLRFDAEARLQTTFARKNAVVLSYGLYPASAYLGFAIARYWGAANWTSTLIQGIEETPVDIGTEEASIKPYIAWEKKESPINPYSVVHYPEVLIFYDRHCKENLWHEGGDHFAHVARWARAAAEQSIDYAFVRVENLAALSRDYPWLPPLVCDSCVCLDEEARVSILAYARAGATVLLSNRNGTLTERGEVCSTDLAALLSGEKTILRLEDGAIDHKANLRKLVSPTLDTEGNDAYALRLAFYEGRPVIHVLNRSLEAVPHPTVVDTWTFYGTQGPVVWKFLNQAKRRELVLTLRRERIPAMTPFELKGVLASPELAESRRVAVQTLPNGDLQVKMDLRDIDIYAVLS